MFFEQVYGKSHSMMLRYLEDGRIIMKWRLVKRFKVLIWLLIPLVAIIAFSTSDRTNFVCALAISCVILSSLIMLAARVILINPSDQKVSSGLEIFWLRFFIPH